MVSAFTRFFVVVLMGVALSGGAFYFVFTKDTAPENIKKEPISTVQLFDYEKFSFQHSNTMSLDARVSPVDTRVYLIDVQAAGATEDDASVLRIQVVPKQTKAACDSLGGYAGNPVAVGTVNVQPCVLQKVFNDEGTGLRIEIPRDEFTVLIFSDRYDFYAADADAILRTWTWKD